MMMNFLPYWIIGLLASFTLSAVPPLWVWGLGMAVLFVAMWRWKVAAVVLCILLGAAYGVWRTESALSQQWPVGKTSDVALTLEVDDLPRIDERRVQFAAQAWDHEGRRYRLLVSDYQLRDWKVGSRWRVSARVRPIVGEVNLRGLNREAWALANGIDGVAVLGKGRRFEGMKGRLNVTAWRQDISHRWQKTDTQDFDFSDGLGLMRALSIGEQSALRTELWQAFRPLGLTHLVSISGLHVTMVAVWFGFLVKLLLHLLPRIPKRPRLWMLVGGVSGALFYAALAGFGVPTQRSVLMLAAFAYAWWRGGGASPWAGWWQALAVVLLFDPLAALGVGLWLSFGLVAALIWSSAGRLNERGWWLALRGQWAATLLSVVLLGWLFASLPVFSPVVNALAIPWFSWVLTPLALLGSILPIDSLKWLAAALAEYTLRFLLWLADYAPEFAVASPPWLLLVLAVGAVLVLLLPRGMGLRPWACIVLAGWVFYRVPQLPEGRLKVWVMDAGQGLSVLMQTREHNLLFDTGTAQAAVTGIVPSLNALGIRHLDTLVLSHHDVDHDGGFAAVSRSLPPGILLAGQPEFYPRADFCRESSWVWNGVVFELLRPSENHVMQDDNEQSCILRVVAGGTALLLTGDLGQKGELALLEKYGERLLSQVLVLGHHGSNTASAGMFLHTVSPQYAVASSGYGNGYGHPTAFVRNKVSAHGATLLRTDLSGTLIFELGAEEIFQGRLKKHKAYWQKKPFE